MEIEVVEPWFSLLQKGIKTVEGRKGSPKWKNLSEGDVVTFSANDGRRLQAHVVKVRKYANLDEFLGSELESALPGIISIEAGAAVYWQWWSPEEVELFGVLAIEVKIQ
jgi:ASC-1-like (ASCH) protein